MLLNAYQDRRVIIFFTVTVGIFEKVVSGSIKEFQTSKGGKNNVK